MLFRSLYHTLDATALSAAECLLKHFGRFGAPYQLRSDRSEEHTSEIQSTDPEYLLPLHYLSAVEWWYTIKKFIDIFVL